MKKICGFLLEIFSFCGFAVAGPEDPWKISVVDSNNREHRIGNAVIRNIKFPDRICETNAAGTDSNCKEKNFEGGKLEIYADRYFGIKAVDIKLKRNKNNKKVELIVPLDPIYNFRIVNSVTKAPVAGVRIENTTYADRFCETDSNGTGINCTGKDLSGGWVKFSIDGYNPINSYNLLEDKRDKDIEMTQSYKFRVIDAQTGEPLERVSVKNATYPDRGCTTYDDGCGTFCTEHDLEGGKVIFSYMGQKYKEQGSEVIQLVFGQEKLISFNVNVGVDNTPPAVVTQDCQQYFQSLPTEYVHDEDVSLEKSSSLPGLLSRQPRFEHAVKLKGTMPIVNCLIEKCEFGWVPDATQQTCRDIRFEQIDKWIRDADLTKNKWKDVSGKFNTARLTSDLTAGVVLGTVGGVVSGVVIKKKQVEKGFDALSCYVGGQKMADWGDEFRVVFTR